MNGKTLAVIAVALIVAVSACAVIIMQMGNDDSSKQGSGGSSEGPSTEETTEQIIDPVIYGDLEIVCVSGSESCYTLSESNGITTLSFSGITEDTEYKISGTMTGHITIDSGDFDFKLSLSGFSLISTGDVPINVVGGNNFTLSASSGTENYVYDNRAAVPTEGISASIYSTCDMDIQGNGSLTVISANNNGIHGKDDLSVKNLTLTVSCVDNALKGNDSVTINSGTIHLTSTSGDGIKTTSTDLNKNGEQRGIVTINSNKGDTTVTIKAYCDGIDSASDVIVEETVGNNLALNIYTYTYANGTTAAPQSGPGGRSSDRTAPGDGSFSPPSWGQDDRGWDRGFGPEGQGNTDQVDFSCKGIKADNSIEIRSGDILIMSYDDAIHANNTNVLESTNVVGIGKIVISGGDLAIATKDDGMHADGELAITGGTISISESYEGIEGDTISISGGDISIYASDDGANAVNTTRTGITISGGELFISAGGDGLDSNTRSSVGVSISSGHSVVISNGATNSSIDTETGYSYTGGYFFGLCLNDMMGSSEAKNTSNFSSVGSSTSLGSLSKGNIITVSVKGSVILAVEMQNSMNSSFAVYLGSSSASIAKASGSYSFDVDGVCWRI